MKLLVVFVSIIYLTVGEKFFADPTPKCCVEYCYTQDSVRPQNLRYGTKTAYQFVKGGESPNVPANCTPQKFWLLSRHGTRLPSSSKIEKLQGLPDYHKEILDNYSKGKQPAVGALCDSDLQLLSTWELNKNITKSMDEYLTEQGWNDLKGLAQHYRALYPTLLGGSYSSDRFTFRHTNTQRTEASYKGFVDGLFGDGAYQTITPPAVPSKDTLLRPNDYCSAWADQEDALEDKNSELTKFENSAIYTQVIEDVSTKAGYSSPLKANRIEWMFEQCFYDLSWEIAKDSPWCTLFTYDQTLIFEYAKDIEEWHLGGSYSTLNTRLACELMQDMLQNLDALSGPEATAYFSHSTTVQLFLTAMGYAHQDVPLRADNYAENANRKFLTSKVSTFATNIAAIRYDCGGEYKIKFFLNERAMDLDWCDNGLCNYADVRTRFANFISADCSSYFCTK